MLVTVSLTLLLVVVLPWVEGQDLVQPGPPDFCFKGDYHVLDHFHKDAPSPEGNDFPECTSWQESSCCTHALSDQISRFTPGEGLYNFSFINCGQISQGCAQYLRNEECFYWCEPMLGYFQAHPSANTQLMNVPVCADYCNAWFEACKDDDTCVENWGQFVYHDITSANTCPQNSTCRTFREVYRDGRGLCNKIWGSEYVYSTDRDNCTVMTFDNTMANPNFKLTFPRSGSMSVVKLGSTMIHGAALLMFLAIAAAIC